MADNITGMIKSAGIFLSLLISSLFFSAGNILAQTFDAYMDSVKAGFLIEAQRVLFNDRFEAADSLYSVYIEQYPDDPAGYFYKAAALLGEMSDREENLYSEQFIHLLDTVEFLTAVRLDSEDPRVRAWMYLFSGHARAYRSLWEARFGSLLSAVRTAFKARADYDEGLEQDSTLVDLYLGLGSYHYWKSARAGIFRWFGILKDDKDRGLEELYKAWRGSTISRESARAALIWVWLDCEEYDSVITIAREVLEKFPGGKSFLWPLAQAYYEKKDYTAALEIYQKLRTMIAPAPGNYYNLIECDFYLNQCYDELGKTDEARRAARDFKAYLDKVPGEIRRKLRLHIGHLKRAART
ncbi:MAG: tetratricopeptide repeat protein [candidate division Zixibacteria bacterium]|nr:tetratricopeptide repeat protein [candidate division Zixibacteria bacterium]